MTRNTTQLPFIQVALEHTMSLNHYLTHVSSDNELYSGTVADFSGSDPIIYREPLQTEQYDSLNLNGNSKFPTL